MTFKLYLLDLGAAGGGGWIQGASKRLFPGCVKIGEKVAFCSPRIQTNLEEPFKGSMHKKLLIRGINNHTS